MLGKVLWILCTVGCTAQSIDALGDNLFCVEGESEMRIVVRRRDGMAWGMGAGRRRPKYR